MEYCPELLSIVQCHSLLRRRHWTSNVGGCVQTGGMSGYQNWKNASSTKGFSDIGTSGCRDICDFENSMYRQEERYNLCSASHPPVNGPFAVHWGV